MNLYVSPNNQKLLWKTMSRSPLFANRPAKEEWFKNIVGEFYENNKHNTTVTLKEINLHTVNYMIKILQEEGSRNQKIVYPTAQMQSQAQLQPIEKNVGIVSAAAAVAPASAVAPATIEPASATAPMPYTKQDLQNVRRNEFDAQLQKMENEHRALLQRDVPPEIDFRDKVAAEKDGPIANIGDLIKMEIEKRNRDIQQFAVSRGSSATIAPPFPPASAPSVLLPQIGSTTAPPPSKKVSWSDNSVPATTAAAAEHKVAVPMDYLTKISEVNETNHKHIIENQNAISEIRETLNKISADIEFIKSFIENRSGCVGGGSDEEPPLLEKTYDSTSEVNDTISPMVEVDVVPEIQEESSISSVDASVDASVEANVDETSVTADAVAAEENIASATTTSAGKRKRKASGKR